jgi:hypothetical protein
MIERDDSTGWFLETTNDWLPLVGGRSHASAACPALGSPLIVWFFNSLTRLLVIFIANRFLIDLSWSSFPREAAKAFSDGAETWEATCVILCRPVAVFLWGTP